jgi:hypothetical protein
VPKLTASTKAEPPPQDDCHQVERERPAESLRHGLGPSLARDYLPVDQSEDNAAQEDEPVGTGHGVTAIAGHLEEKGLVVSSGVVDHHGEEAPAAQEIESQISSCGALLVSEGPAGHRQAEPTKRESRYPGLRYCGHESIVVAGC